MLEQWLQAQLVHDVVVFLRSHYLLYFKVITNYILVLDNLFFICQWLLAFANLDQFLDSIGKQCELGRKSHDNLQKYVITDLMIKDDELVSTLVRFIMLQTQ